MPKVSKGKISKLSLVSKLPYLMSGLRKRYTLLVAQIGMAHLIFDFFFFFFGMNKNKRYMPTGTF